MTEQYSEGGNAERRFKPGDRVASSHSPAWGDCTVVEYVERPPFAGQVRVKYDGMGFGIIKERHLELIDTGPTEAERRFAAVVADNARLRARVDELLAANNRLVQQRRDETERVECAKGMIAGFEKAFDVQRDMIDGLRHENGTAWASVERQNNLLAEAAARFREYEKHHDERARAGITKALNASNKDDWWRQAKVANEAGEKAARNREMAERLEAAIQPIQTEEGRKEPQE